MQRDAHTEAADGAAVSGNKIAYSGAKGVRARPAKVAKHVERGGPKKPETTDKAVELALRLILQLDEFWCQRECI